MMDLDVLAMGRGERLDLLMLQMVMMMNQLWDSFRLHFVWMIHYYFAVELKLLPDVLAQVVAVAVAVERIAEDCNCCFHSHHHISDAAVVEDDIHRSTHLLRRELMML